MADLRAPFPWFGGKSTVAAQIWARFGDPVNYVEPFFGSGAVLLARPTPPRVETVNDKDRMLANFWRAVQADPEAVARHADWPTNEVDLHARHWWLLTEGSRRIAAIEGNPELYDAQVAGWWVWGACNWIAQGWCSGDGPWSWDEEAGEWVNRQLPHLSAGRGINRQLPHLSAGQGINRKLPHLSAGRAAFILDWMQKLSARLRHVRVACGDWSRVTGPSVTHGHGLTAVFLDPPYSLEERDDGLYACEDGDAAAAAREWAIAQGDNPLMRICLAGYDGEHDFPDTWTAVRWKAKGGYGSQGDGRGRENASRETLWFSPHCLNPEQQADLFARGAA